MKLSKVMGPIIIIMIMMFMLPLHVGADGLGNARLSLIDGDVQIRPEDSSEWLPASINMPLREGDSIWVPDNGKAEVQLTAGSQVRLDEQSALEIVNLDKDSAQFYLTEGSAYLNFTGRSRLLQVDTPLSTIRAYERAAFAVDVAGNGETDVSVYRGSVDAESRSGRTTVNAGKMLSIGDNYADIAPLGRSDDWERWNMERDRRFEDGRFTSGRYLPDELDTYARDFDDNGRWVHVRDYGYVWTPTVAVSVGWSPYRHGRWCWIGGDYVWVGYEPWGWAPYHYGRWSFAASIGWFWVPPGRGAVYWGPGYVGWVSTPTYVAWVPLAPRETYYGHGHYGPHSVNITNVNVNKVVVKKVYKNVYVNNSVTVIHHDTFVKGKHVDFKHHENPFLKERVHIGRPNIKPERETRMPVMRDIPRVKEPPQKVREIKVKEIKKQRPFVKEKNRSVLSPNAPGKELKLKAIDAPKERKRGRAFEKRPERSGNGKPAEKQQPEQKKTVPANMKKYDERGTRAGDRREMKQKESRPDAQSAQKPSPAQKQRQPDQRGAQPGKMRREGGGTEPQPADRPSPSKKQRQPDQLKLQKQQEERKMEQPKKKELKAPPAGEPSQQRIRHPEEGRGQAPARLMQREKHRRQEGVKEAAPQQSKQQEKGKKAKEQQPEEPQPEGQIQQLAGPGGRGHR